MGLFDSVWMPCPGCGTAIEFQSKAGECGLTSYSMDDAPLRILADIDGDIESCPKCERVAHFRIVPAGWKGVVD
jgi:hypothetical protein